MAWTKVASAGTTTIVNNTSATASGQTNKKPVVCFIFDDTNISNYNTFQSFLDKNAPYTTGLRQDYIGAAGGGLTFDMVKEMQDKGIEIAYHGMTHNYTSVNDYLTDIPQYMDIVKQHGININGFIGPNGDYSESIVFHTFFDIFKWARGGGASNGVTNIKAPSDYFKQIVDSNSFIDDIASDAAVATAKTKIDVLASRGTGIMHLSQHFTATTSPYLLQLVDYINSKGISIMTVSQAYEFYGAVYEFYDSTLQLGADFNKRVGGNGGTSINAAMPHFILQKDGTIISNMGVKMVPPVYKGAMLNGNTLPDSFDVGISIVQYGSLDNHASLPNIGTLYNFNLGKDAGEQFQLYKSYNTPGLFYRDANTDNTWKTSGFTDKLGIFRAAVPTASTSTGSKGDWSANANYLYVCYADNNWIRIPKDTVAW